MKVNEMERLLRKHGCYPVDEGSKHTMWYSPITKKEFPLSRHKSQDLKKTEHLILKQAGIKR